MRDFWEGCLAPFLGLVFIAAAIVSVGYLCKSTLDDAASRQTSYVDFYTAKGITGPHRLVVLDPTGNELQGKFSGSVSYFLVVGGGSVEGSVQTGDVIQFEWVIPTGKSQIIEVPYSMVIWDFDDKYETPTFEFNFSQSHLEGILSKNTEIINFNSVFSDASAITIHTTRTQYIQDVQSKIKK